MTTQSQAGHAADTMKHYFDDLKHQHMAPLWAVLKGLVPREPAPRSRPHLWRYPEARQALLRAGELISAEEAERRVLVLENPGWTGESRITDTLYAGLQLILPGEVAPAHRHTQSALRFVLEGQGGYTSVDGERTDMHPGDFIITPTWTWHDHGHDGSDPVIWMDGLDVPLVTFIRGGFREEHDDKNHPVTRGEGDALARYGSNMLPIRHPRASHTSPIFNYPYERTRETLHRLARASEIDPHLGICLRYINPVNGDWAIATIGSIMRLIPKGWEGRFYRSTDSTVLVVTEGLLRIEMDDGERFALQPNDVFALPGWRKYRLLGSDTDTVVFSFNDRPVQEKLGLWREWLD